MLRKHDFQAIAAPALSVLDQASLFNKANIVIARHGAGLANIAFCQTGKKILEVFPPYWTPLCYAQLAAQRDLEYHFMLAQSLGAMRENTRRRYEFQPDYSAETRTLSIPAEELENWLEAVEC